MLQASITEIKPVQTTEKAVRRRLQHTVDQLNPSAMDYVTKGGISHSVDCDIVETGFEDIA